MPNLDCRRCKDWRGCPGKEWYSYSEVRWCAQQTFWLLKYAETLRQGIWPIPEMIVPFGSRPSISTEAAFTRACEVIAELDKRLETTGWRGRLLQEECVNREKIMYLSDDARSALYYVSGWRRKDSPFLVWRRMKSYRKRNKMGFSKCASISR